ncbi:hypothetical protein [Phocicoccus pinnipedialis]|uniref:DNA polymerase III subunit tau n=1 Tax=Phocicoccus pinnipedialis TaxID=110845 RepID=A0A6V7R3K0_9BACL|nr:hypothetical protein [Jeotgalicoccus pinnipedialis]MBP1940121.1 DNA polymerase-3 subunit delta' [Jeotgalicoccus pinnipedialis]CAD2071931.1 DNA polymerase III subunit tau [Jeotgalicoccus pinnipedialis]
MTHDATLKAIIENNRLVHTYMIDSDAIETARRVGIDFATMILGGDEETRALIKSGNHPDYYYLRTDEMTIKKDDISDVVRLMNQKPIHSEYKVYIIESFEKLTVQAENSILKFLEEPPQKTVALLLTTDKSSILPTIHSRAQHLSFKGTDDDRKSALTELSEPLQNIAHILKLDTNHVLDLGEGFSEIVNAANHFGARWLNDHPLVLIDLTRVLDVLKERRDYILMLTLLDGYVRQAMYELLGIEGFSPFKSEPLTNAVNIGRLSKMLEEIEKANQLITSNVNPTLVFESMIIRLKG